MSNVMQGEPLPGAGRYGDWRDNRRAGVLIALAAAAVVVLVVVVNAVHGASTSNASANAASSMTGMPTMGATSSSGSSMAMSTPSGAAGATASTHGIALVTGVKATTNMPSTMSMTPLGQATWQGMVVAARATAPLPFILFNGTNQQVVNPTPKTSFHLMVSLTDASTGFAIPYSSIWATITRHGRVVFDERLWPMISRYMGPHYGDNVDLPGAGVYRLTLLVSPPAAARHIEYKGLWLQPHRVSLAFNWRPAT